MSSIENYCPKTNDPRYAHMIAADTILFVFKHDVSGPGRSYEALVGINRGLGYRPESRVFSYFPFLGDHPGKLPITPVFRELHSSFQRHRQSLKL
jgi:hypothetical protein